MSNIDLIIEERSRDIGGFLVGRLLPFRKKRMVGPFIFIDHMGPTELTDGKTLSIGQHPHIGLSTLTFLFEGEVRHRDTTGADAIISPGSVNWMTAGKGAVHTEQGIEGVTRIHGYQIWVALPKELEDMEPMFSHTPANELPMWTEDGVEYTLVAGKVFGKQSPVPVHSNLFMVHMQSKQEAVIDTKDNLFGEIGICVVEGWVEAEGERVEKGNMLISNSNHSCQFKMGANTKLLIFGGDPFPEERYIYWNFVSSDKDTIERAKQMWANKEFKMIEGDDSYIPLPK